MSEPREPSMAEILSSVRRVVAEGEQPQPRQKIAEADDGRPDDGRNEPQFTGGAAKSPEPSKGLRARFPIKEKAKQEPPTSKAKPAAPKPPTLILDDDVLDLTDIVDARGQAPAPRDEPRSVPVSDDALQADRDALLRDEEFNAWLVAVLKPQVKQWIKEELGSRS